MNHRLLSVAAGAALVSAGLSFGQSVTYDVTATTSGSGVSISSDQKQVVVTTPGAQVNLALSVMIDDTGINPGTDDGPVSGAGSFLSSDGGLQGTLSASRVADFDFITSQDGTQTDLDSDGDLDVGSLDNNAGVNDWFIFVSDNLLNLSPPTPALNTVVGTGSFTLTGTNGSTSVNFLPAVSNGAHAFEINGVLTDWDGATSLGSVGAPVEISFASLVGDVDFDGDIDIDDLAVVLSEWTGSTGTGKFYTEGDLDGDTDVDIDDLAVQLSGWTGSLSSPSTAMDAYALLPADIQAQIPAPVAVPEPTTLALFGFGCLALRRRRK